MGKWAREHEVGHESVVENETDLEKSKIKSERRQAVIDLRLVPLKLIWLRRSLLLSPLN